MAMFKLECFTQAFAMNKFFWCFLVVQIPKHHHSPKRMTLQNYYEKMSAANFRMRLFAPAQNGAEWRNFLEVFFWIFPRIIIFSRFSPRRFTSQGTTAPQVRGQPIAMCDCCSTFAPQFKIIARSPHSHRIITAHAYTSKQQANKVFPEDASRVLKLWTRLFKIKQDFF